MKNILLKPFMTVAGDDAKDDRAGSEAESWTSMLAREGFIVTPVLQGLGEIDSFADVFVSHLSDLAHDHAIVLE